MVNREKIIILVMIIVVAYGGYSYFFGSDDNIVVQGSKQKLSEMKKFVIDAATSLSNEYISDADKYIIDQADKVWPQDTPFLQSGAHLTSEPFEARAEVTVQTVQISYSGFLQTADALIAIVNGTEYETGDQLSETGYYVKKISPAKIVLGLENNSDTIVLPLDEPVNMSLEEKE